MNRELLAYNVVKHQSMNFWHTPKPKALSHHKAFSLFFTSAILKKAYPMSTNQIANHQPHNLKLSSAKHEYLNAAKQRAKTTSPLLLYIYPQ